MHNQKHNGEIGHWCFEVSDSTSTVEYIRVFVSFILKHNPQNSLSAKDYPAYLYWEVIDENNFCGKFTPLSLNMSEGRVVLFAEFSSCENTLVAGSRQTSLWLDKQCYRSKLSSKYGYLKLILLDYSVAFDEIAFSTFYSSAVFTSNLHPWNCNIP